MRIAKRLLPLLALSLSPLLAAGCAPPPSPDMFNDKICEFTEQLFTTARAFRTALVPMFFKKENDSNLPPDPAKVRQVQQQAVDKVRQIREEFKNYGSPRDSPTGDKLREAFDDFLAVQETIATEHYKKIVDIIDNPAITDKESAVLAVLKASEEAEIPAATTLATAHSEFAKAHNLSPVGGMTLVRPPENPNAVFRPGVPDKDKDKK